MNLLQQITFPFALSEGQGPVSVKLTLDEIIRDGKVTNPYQIFVLGWVSEFFKNGMKAISLHLENPIDFESRATHVDVVNTLKSLTPENQVNLAKYLKDCIDQGESYLHDNTSRTEDWMRYVLRAQR